jgi:hypothetical protein
MNKITQENYFSVNNGALSNSKIKDFLLDKNYFYRKHILGEVEQKKTKSFLIGDVTDNILTEINTKNYAVCQFDGRTKDGKEERARYEADGKIVISQQDYDLILNIADAVFNTDAYKSLADFKKQEIIQIEMDLGEHFSVLAGKPDFYQIKDGVCTIVDLKTTTSIDERKYHYTCLEYGYYNQLALYGYILSKLYQEIKSFEYYHLAVAKIQDIYPVGVFRLSNDRISMVQEYLINEVLQAIKNEKEFKKYNPTMNSAITIGELVEVF